MGILHRMLARNLLRQMQLGLQQNLLPSKEQVIANASLPSNLKIILELHRKKINSRPFTFLRKTLIHIVKGKIDNLLDYNHAAKLKLLEVLPTAGIVNSLNIMQFQRLMSLSNRAVLHLRDRETCRGSCFGEVSSFELCCGYYILQRSLSKQR